MKTARSCSCRFRTKNRCGEAYPVNVGRRVFKNTIRHYWKCSKCGETWIQVVEKAKAVASANDRQLDFSIDDFENVFVCEITDVTRHNDCITIKFKNEFAEGVIYVKNVVDIYHLCKQQREYHKA